MSPRVFRQFGLIVGPHDEPGVEFMRFAPDNGRVPVLELLLVLETVVLLLAFVLSAAVEEVEGYEDEEDAAEGDADAGD